MLFHKLVALCAMLWATSVLSQTRDVLMVEGAEQTTEYELLGELGRTVQVVSLTTFGTMTTADFAKYRAVVIQRFGTSCPVNVNFPNNLDFLGTSKARWGPAITGHVVLQTNGCLGRQARANGGIPSARAYLKNILQRVTSGAGTGFYVQFTTSVSGSASTLGFLDALGDIRFRTGELRSGIYIVDGSDSIMQGQTSVVMSTWTGLPIHAVWERVPTNWRVLAISTLSSGTGSGTYGTVAGVPITGVPCVIVRDGTGSFCGNGRPDGTEQCDDGSILNAVATNKCNNQCQCRFGSDPNGTGGVICRDAPRCGDSRIDAEEQCDDGDVLNNGATNKCNNQCRCRYGSTPNGMGGVTCWEAPRCGDGRLDAEEQCDDGDVLNSGATNKCNNQCRCRYGSTSNGMGGVTCWEAPRCGDSRIDANEQCDEGALNGVGTNKCNAECQCKYGSTSNGMGGFTCWEAPRCGDSRIDTGEQCDDGSALNGVGTNKCNAECECRYGSDANGSGFTCWEAPRCGDNRIDADEQCDDGTALNGVGTNKCDAECKCKYGSDSNGSGFTCWEAPRCGDNRIDADEQCDEGALNGVGTNICGADCQCAHGSESNGMGGVTCKPATITPTCGNGVLDTGEECDTDIDPLGLCGTDCKCLHGTESNGFGVTVCKQATITTTCGNGSLDLDEECDPMADASGLCGSDCKCLHGTQSNGMGGFICKQATTTVTCGNGVVDTGEECDPALDPSNLCDGDCKCLHGTESNGNGGLVCKQATTTVTCGNGIVDADEECDPNLDPLELCGSDCKCAHGLGGGLNGEDCKDAPACGDGTVDTGEQCDDGIQNGEASSHCSLQCKCKIGPVTGGGGGCRGPETCGNSNIDAEELCDNGESNGKEGNFCTSACTCSFGFNQETSECIRTPPRCGDGVVGVGEQCDEGQENGQQGSLCSATCRCAFGYEVGTGCRSALNPPPPSGSITPSVPSVPSLTTPGDGGPSITPPPDNSRVGVEFIYFIEEDEERDRREKRQAESPFTRFIYSRVILGLAVRGQPFYPDVIGFPERPALETTTTIRGAPDATPTFAFKLCEDCPITTTVVDVTGYTPGVCNGCVFVTEFHRSRPPPTGTDNGRPVVTPPPNTRTHGAAGQPVTVVTITETVYGYGPDPKYSTYSCIEHVRTFTIVPEWCTTYTSTLGNGDVTTCIDALPGWTPPPYEGDGGRSHEFDGGAGRGGAQDEFQDVSFNGGSEAGTPRPHVVAEGGGDSADSHNGRPDGVNRQADVGTQSGAAAGGDTGVGAGVGAGAAAAGGDGSRVSNDAGGDADGEHIQVAGAGKVTEGLFNTVILVLAGLFL